MPLAGMPLHFVQNMPAAVDEAILSFIATTGAASGERSGRDRTSADTAAENGLLKLNQFAIPPHRRRAGRHSLTIWAMSRRRLPANRAAVKGIPAAHCCVWTEASENNVCNSACSARRTLQPVSKTWRYRLQFTAVATRRIS